MLKVRNKIRRLNNTQEGFTGYPETHNLGPIRPICANSLAAGNKMETLEEIVCRSCHTIISPNPKVSSAEEKLVLFLEAKLLYEPGFVLAHSQSVSHSGV